MAATNNRNNVITPDPASGTTLDSESDTPAKPDPDQPGPHSAPRKLLSLVNGLMDLMVDGLAPGVKQQRRSYDLIVVGAGPAGTAAAVCAASEGVDTLIVEAGQADGGGQFIECIDNCAATPRGVTMGSGAELAEKEGHRFLLDMQPGLAVTGIRSGNGYWQVETNQGSIGAKSLILAPGLRRRHLNVPGEKELIGSGIHTCAACDGPAYAGEDVVVVGSDALGMEQALTLATLARSVTVVEQSARAKCSRELNQQVEDQSNINVTLDRRVLRFKGFPNLTSVLVENTRTGEVEELSAAGAFITVGLEPATSAFREAVAVDESGFIKTDRGMETRLGGVFAAGHARSRQIQGPEDAASDGYKAGRLVIRYLDKARA